MVIKIYKCKLCMSRGKKFEGLKQTVRKHLREEHMIKKDKGKNIIAEELEK